MVDVSSKHAENPLGVIAQGLHIPLAQALPQLELPSKILFPSVQHPGQYSVLGLGDVVVPGQ